MAKPKSAFTGKFRQYVDPTDAVLRECKRKVAYPLRHMAEKDADAESMRTGEVLQVYTCRHCGKFHFGHPSAKSPAPNVPEEPQAPQVVYKTATAAKATPKVPKIWGLPPIKAKEEELPLIDTTNIAKLGDDFRNFYIFQMPPEMPHTENNMLEHGVLIAMKKGEENYKEPDGTRSPLHKWRAYHHNVGATYTRKKVYEFQKAIAHHLETFGGSKTEEPVETPSLHNPVVTPAIAKKLTQQKADEYKGKKIWRDQDGKAFLKKEAPCASCKDPIHLLSRVYEPNGVFTSSLPYFAPDDPKAKPTAAGKHTWLCGKCACPSKEVPKEEQEQKEVQEEVDINAQEEPSGTGAPQEKEMEQSEQQEQQQPAAAAAPVEQDDFLTALQKMTEDQSVPSEQIRGMAFVAVKYLRAVR